MTTAATTAMGVGAGVGAGVVTERELGAFYQVAGWPGEEFEKSAGALLGRLGFAGLGDFRMAQTAGEGGEAGWERLSFRVGPERILIRLPEAGVMTAALAGLDVSLSPVLDLTGSRRVFRVGDAEGGVGVLSRLAAVDFSLAAFPAGAFAQAECLGTGMLFHRAGAAAYDVYVPRSWGESLRELAETAGGM